MLIEQDILPYSPGELPLGPWLVFAPHPDDETFGLGGALALAARAGIEVIVVILTDGALGGSGDPRELCAVRKTEARAAMARLGVAELLFWDEPDRGLRVCDELIDRVAALIDRHAPAHVFFPSPMEPHVDHRAAAELVWEGLRRSRDRHALPAAYDITVQGPVNRLIDITEVITVKREAIEAYASQLRENDYYDVARALDAARIFTLPPEVRAAEGVYLWGREALRLDYAATVKKVLEPYWSGRAIGDGGEPGRRGWFKRFIGMWMI